MKRILFTLSLLASSSMVVTAEHAGKHKPKLPINQTKPAQRPQTKPFVVPVSGNRTDMLRPFFGNNTDKDSGKGGNHHPLRDPRKKPAHEDHKRCYRGNKCTIDRDEIPDCNITSNITGLQKPEMNTTTCCYTCRPVSQKKPQRLGKHKKCTKESHKACVSALPACVTMDEQKKSLKASLKEKLRGSCCGFCRRPQSNCTIASIAKGWKKLSKCSKDDIPVRVEGSCLPSCKPQRKECAQKCGKGFACGVRGCQRMRKRKYLLRLTRQFKKELSNVTKEEMRTVLIEIVERFCERYSNRTIKLCDNVEEFIDTFNCLNVIQVPQDPVSNTTTVVTDEEHENPEQQSNSTTETADSNETQEENPEQQSNITTETADSNETQEENPEQQSNTTTETADSNETQEENPEQQSNTTTETADSDETQEENPEQQSNSTAETADSDGTQEDVLLQVEIEELAPASVNSRRRLLRDVPTNDQPDEDLLQAALSDPDAASEVISTVEAVRDIVNVEDENYASETDDHAANGASSLSLGIISSLASIFFASAAFV